MSYPNYRRPPRVEYTGPTRASINKSNMQGWVDVVTPYNRHFVEELKTATQP